MTHNTHLSRRGLPAHPVELALPKAALAADSPDNVATFGMIPYAVRHISGGAGAAAVGVAILVEAVAKRRKAGNPFPTHPFPTWHVPPITAL